MTRLPLAPLQSPAAPGSSGEMPALQPDPRAPKQCKPSGPRGVRASGGASKGGSKRERPGSILWQPRGRRGGRLSPHPASLIPHPPSSSFSLILIPHPSSSSFILLPPPHSSFLIPHPHPSSLILIPQLSSLIPHPSLLLPCPSPLTPRSSSLLPPPYLVAACVPAKRAAGLRSRVVERLSVQSMPGTR